MGAGILPVALHRGKLLFLFGKEHVGGKWSDFGGSPIKNETKFQTAIREGYEETDNFLPHILLTSYHLAFTQHWSHKCRKQESLIWHANLGLPLKLVCFFV